jgi:Helix-turn-helix domain
MPFWLTIAQAAKQLDVHPIHVAQLVQAGLFRETKADHGLIMIARREISRLLKSGFKPFSDPSR